VKWLSSPFTLPDHQLHFVSSVERVHTVNAFPCVLLSSLSVSIGATRTRPSIGSRPVLETSRVHDIIEVTFRRTLRHSSFAFLTGNLIYGYVLLVFLF
jgi:hypothetical protein